MESTVKAIQGLGPETLIVLAAVAAYANTLLAKDFIWDDRSILISNFLLRGWSARPRLGLLLPLFLLALLTKEQAVVFPVLLGLWDRTFRRRRPWDRGARGVYAGMAACAFFLPASNLIVPLDRIGGERFMYFPSVAVCLLLARGRTRSKRFGDVDISGALGRAPRRLGACRRVIFAGVGIEAVGRYGSF